MNILGIETSCDETSASVVRSGTDVLSNVVISSLKEHARYGGIIPEIASRRQLECIQAVVGEALEKADLSLSAIEAIAVTAAPGLIGSLLVGVSFARALGYSLNKKVVDVDHIKAHVYANFLKLPGEKKKVVPKLPSVGLVVSGGHTSLFYIKDFNHFKMLGQTRDDAAGEAFDKVAKILDLGYPGGPVIDRLAQKGTRSRLRFSPASVPDFDFSFSGIKTAVLYHKRDHGQSKEFSVENVAYAFQESVVESLVQNSLSACRRMKTKTLLVGGGVAANSRLRQSLAQECHKEKIRVFFPPMSLCLDNAAMIAGLGFRLCKGSPGESRLKNSILSN